MINLLNKQIFSRLKLLISWTFPKNFTGVVECPDGDKFWLLNGKCHRTNGPAVEYFNKSKCWYLNGNAHREDGPAVELIGGWNEWCLNGKRYSKKKWEKEIKKIKHDKFPK